MNIERKEKIEMNKLNEIVQEMGFKDEKEFHKLIARIDISTPEKNTKFRHWQFHNGTKGGLLKLKTIPSIIVKKLII